MGVGGEFAATAGDDEGSGQPARAGAVRGDLLRAPGGGPGFDRGRNRGGDAVRRDAGAGVGDQQRDGVRARALGLSAGEGRAGGRLAAGGAGGPRLPGRLPADDPAESGDQREPNRRRHRPPRAPVVDHRHEEAGLRRHSALGLHVDHHRPLIRRLRPDPTQARRGPPPLRDPLRHAQPPLPDHDRLGPENRRPPRPVLCRRRRQPALRQAVQGQVQEPRRALGLRPRLRRPQALQDGRRPGEGRLRRHRDDRPRRHARSRPRAHPGDPRRPLRARGRAPLRRRRRHRRPPVPPHHRRTQGALPRPRRRLGRRAPRRRRRRPRRTRRRQVPRRPPPGQGLPQGRLHPAHHRGLRRRLDHAHDQRRVHQRPPRHRRHRSRHGGRGRRRPRPHAHPPRLLQDRRLAAAAALPPGLFPFFSLPQENYPPRLPPYLASLDPLGRRAIAGGASLPRSPPTSADHTQLDRRQAPQQRPGAHSARLDSSRLDSTRLGGHCGMLRRVARAAAR
mmetsp:Transcript_20299/g.63776  ORF Transcript_20299/g.63776 Transcript_20299/m.63776 type:complete len:505 (-) Transcript_20299:1359-2873(-)